MATAKKSTAKKATTPVIKGEIRTRHDRSRAAAASQVLKSASAGRALAELPEGFTAEGFEIIGDVMRVYGKVRRGEPAPAPDYTANAAVNQVMGAVHERLVTGLAESYGGEPQAIKVSPMESALDSNAVALNRLDDALSFLEKVCNNVLAMEPPSAPQTAAGSGPSGVGPATDAPAVNQLNNQTFRLHSLVARLNGIANRVQA